MKKIIAPFINRKELENLFSGEEVLLSGIIFTARDAAHKKIFESKKAPLDLQNQIIYYTGPTPTPKNKIIGSCGPTTSSRMDNFTHFMIENIGISGMIGKGKRNNSIINLCKANKVIYFLAPGGCGALLAKSIKKFELVAYPELLSEAIYKLEVEDMPLTVGVDIFGNDVYIESAIADL